MVLSSSVNAGHTLHSSYRTPGWVQHLPTVRTSHLRPSLCDVQSRLLFPFYVISMNWSSLYENDFTSVLGLCQPQNHHMALAPFSHFTRGRPEPSYSMGWHVCVCLNHSSFVHASTISSINSNPSGPSMKPKNPNNSNPTYTDASVSRGDSPTCPPIIRTSRI